MKKLSRQPRIHTPNTIHHVIVRGNNRQQIFYGEEYFKRFLEIIAESAIKFDHKIMAYCLMTNHIHLIIKINHASLSDVMQNINYRYARWVNKKQNRVGHLFQSRYWSSEVSDENYLVNLCRYIHLNPVSAKMVDFGADYLWSSHNNYNAPTFLNPDWFETDLMLAAIFNKTGLNYSDFMRHEPERDKWKPALYLSDTGKIIVNDDVARDLHKNNASSSIKKIFLENDLIEFIVCKHLKIDTGKLYGASKDRTLSKKRILLAHYWLKYTDIQMSDIGRMFHKTHGTLSRQIQNFKQYPDKYFEEILLHNIENDCDKELQRISIN